MPSPQVNYTISTTSGGEPKEFIRQTMVAALNTYKKADFVPNMETSATVS
jgi:hypothetical protein